MYLKKKRGIVKAEEVKKVKGKAIKLINSPFTITLKVVLLLRCLLRKKGTYIYSVEENCYLNGFVLFYF